MIQIIYASTTSKPPSESDLLNLLNTARARNMSRQITGMLLYSNNTYLQLLEGESKVVLDLYDKICRDPRNQGNTILQQSEVFTRDFPDWSMGFENLEGYAADELPGYIEVFGGKLDTSVAVNNKTNAIRLLMSFRK